MAGVALLFPGQGAQYVGMGKDLAEQFPRARKIFEHGNEILGFDITRICFEGPEDALTQTENAQPAIFLTSMAALEVFRDCKNEARIEAVCGLSAGEFSALVAAGCLSFDAALRLVRKRGELMTRAAKAHPGTMASVIGLTYEQCQEIARESKAAVANINSPTQIVFSGTEEAVASAGKLAKEKGAKKVIPLKVSGAFHSPLMRDAQDGLSRVLQEITIHQPKSGVHFIANVSGKEVYDTGEISKGLAAQVVSSVRWVDCIQSVVSLGVTEAYEVGPGKVLKGLAERISDTLRVHTWGSVNDVKCAAEPNTKS